MARRLALLSVVVGMLSGSLWAGGAPALATPEEAKLALEKFQVEFEAKGLKGDERLAVREKAMRELAKVQYPTVADRLAKLSRDKDADLRTLAIMYLGEQTALPGYSGKAVVTAIDKGSDDPVFLMFCGDALGSLDYRGQVEVLRKLLGSKSDAVRKHVLVVIGEMKETRLIQAVLDLMVELKIDKGEKWSGGEVSVDTGAAGDADQRAAEAAYAAQHPGGHHGKAASRRLRDLKPTLLHCMKALTGQEFATTDGAKKWVEEHQAEIEARNQELNALQKEQDKAAKYLEAQIKALK